MRTKLKHLIAVIALLCALLIGPLAQAQHFNGQEGYVTATAATNGTTPTVIFAGAAGKSIRVTGINVESTTNAAHLHVIIGQTRFDVTGVINVTNLVVASNAGIVIGQPVILQHTGTNWYATVHTTNQLTNVVLAGGSGLGFTPLTNSQLWKCYQPFLDQIGVAKRQTAGEALFAAPVRAPLAVLLDPPAVASASNRLSVTVKFGTAGSP